ncbi:MAG TPA: hypothetical protein VLD83_12535 [Candidatus Binatia bacterium]|nr:hypothetical protein [Candidatus Binatia bacterium]
MFAPSSKARVRRKLHRVEDSVKCIDDVKVRDVYSSYVLIAGVACFILGIGNWVVGAVETTKYQKLLHRTEQTGLEESYKSFQELDQQKNEEVLRRINEDREKYNAARVKLNFFYVVLTGGKTMFLCGVLLMLLSVIRLIRRDAQMKMNTLSGWTKTDNAGT